MRYRNGFLLITVLFSIVICACLPAAPGIRPPGRVLPVEVFMAGQHCPPAPQSWTVTWISTPEQLQKMVSRCRSNRIGGIQETLPGIDYERFRVLAVEMGGKPTSGYGFRKDKITAKIKNETVILKLEYYEPDPQTVTAQMETSPWILIRLPVGKYDEIRVLDREDHLLARIECHEK